MEEFLKDWVVSIGGYHEAKNAKQAERMLKIDINLFLENIVLCQEKLSDKFLDCAINKLEEYKDYIEGCENWYNLTGYHLPNCEHGTLAKTHSSGLSRPEEEIELATVDTLFPEEDPMIPLICVIAYLFFISQFLLFYL